MELEPNKVRYKDIQNNKATTMQSIPTQEYTNRIGTHVQAFHSQSD